jgi:hypothetical protein
LRFKDLPVSLEVQILPGGNVKISSKRAVMALSIAIAGSTAAAAPPAPPAPPPAKTSGPSNYLKCDGQPNNVTTGETVARLVGAVTLLGLFAPAHEAADASKRLSGADGVAACDVLLADGGEGNPDRRAQLQLARALHRIEMKDFTGAITDAKALEASRSAVSGTPEYRLGLGLSVQYVEALALAGMEKTDAAADKALDIAEAAPYDLLAMSRVHPLVALGGRYGPREQAYYDRLVKLMPLTLASRAEARQYAHDYRGAAQDYDLLSTILDSYLKSDTPDGLRAASALMSYLAGDAEAGARKEAEARIFIDKQEAEGKERASQVENLDLVNIVKLADKGDMRQARLLFAGRTKWTEPSPALLADLSERLRKGAPQDDMIGLLAKPSAEFLTDSRTVKLGLINAAGKTGERRFSSMAPLVSRAAFDRFSPNLWRSGDSRYVAKKPAGKSDAWPVSVYRDGNGVEGGYALLLASALEARKRGVKSFALYPLRMSTSIAQVRFGNPGDTGTPEQISFDAEKVIADLGPLFPPPAKH